MCAEALYPKGEGLLVMSKLYTRISDCSKCCFTVMHDDMGPDPTKVSGQVLYPPTLDILVTAIQV